MMRFFVNSSYVLSPINFPVGQTRFGRRRHWELLKRAESEGDTRGAVVALREARECLATLAGMLSGNKLDLASGSDDAILEEARRRGLNIHGQYVLSERERREAEATILGPIGIISPQQ